MFFSKLFNLFSSDIAIDLGTANTVLAIRGKGIVLHEPSVVALHKKTKTVLAVGSSAKNMVGKTPLTISAVYPLSSGVISDFDATTLLLKTFLEQIGQTSTLSAILSRPRAVVGVPSELTEVERRAVSDAVVSAGAKSVFLIEEPIAAAIGAGLPIEDPTGSMIVDIGGGTSEIAIISLGGIVSNKSLRIAGSEMDRAIIDYAKVNFHLLLGSKSAEEVKIGVGSACQFQGEEDLKIHMRGRDLETGLPKSLEVGVWEIRSAMRPVIDEIVQAVKDRIEATPPELVVDIIRQGIYLTGGGSQVRGLDKLLSEEVGIPIHCVEDPTTSVVRGCERLLGNLDLLNKVKIN